MRKLTKIFIVMLIVITSNVFGQDSLNMNPEFPEGDKAVLEYFADNVEYPQEALDKGQEGIIYIKFVVNADGTISDIGFSRKSRHEALDKEALRLVKNMSNWTPGKIKTDILVPIRFELTAAQLKKCAKKTKKEYKQKIKNAKPTASEKKQQKKDVKKHRKEKKEHQNKIKP